MALYDKRIPSQHDGRDDDDEEKDDDSSIWSVHRTEKPTPVWPVASLSPSHLQQIASSNLEAFLTEPKHYYTHSSSTLQTAAQAPAQSTYGYGNGAVHSSASNLDNEQNSPTASPDPNGAEDHKSSKAPILTGVIVMVVFIVLICGGIFLCLRRRRRQSAQPFTLDETKEQEMAGLRTQPSPEVVPAFHAIPMPVTSLAAAPPEAQPIILSHTNPSTSHAYYTGLDTSDMMSITSAGTRTTHLDEPPPPYRPRSAMASRNSSVRQPHRQSSSASASNKTGYVSARSPFDDPSDDDAISEISSNAGTARLREDDEFSAVSEISYQSGFDRSTSTRR